MRQILLFALLLAITNSCIVSRNILNKSNLNSLEKDTSTYKTSFTLKEARENFETEYLTSQLKKNHGNISRTADFIGMERSALHRKLKLLGIKGIN